MTSPERPGLQHSLGLAARPGTFVTAGRPGIPERSGFGIFDEVGRCKRLPYFGGGVVLPPLPFLPFLPPLWPFFPPLWPFLPLMELPLATLLETISPPAGWTMASAVSV